MNTEDIVHWLYGQMMYLDGFVYVCGLKWKKQVLKEIDYCFYLICLLTEEG
jgi:hypothetical protein